MILLSYRARGSDTAWHAGIAHDSCTRDARWIDQAASSARVASCLQAFGRSEVGR